MSCNCNNISPCSKCQNNLPCNCPTDYTVPAVIAPCTCCPPGYSYNGRACTNSSGGTTGSIPCTECTDAIPTDCVIYKANSSNTVGCFGFADGDSLSVMFQKMCNTLAYTVLTQIGNNTSLQNMLCNLNANCPPAGSGKPNLINGVPVCCPPGYTYSSTISNVCVYGTCNFSNLTICAIICT